MLALACSQDGYDSLTKQTLAEDKLLTPVTCQLSVVLCCILPAAHDHACPGTTSRWQTLTSWQAAGICQLCLTLGLPLLQLMTKEPEQFTDLAGVHKRLSQAGVQHGDLLFMHYSFERTVAPAVKKTIFDGALRKMTVEQLIAKQTRIERWGSSV